MNGEMTAIHAGGKEATGIAPLNDFQLALARLTNEFQQLDRPEGFSFAACRVLGETLLVSRVGYGTIDPVAETLFVDRDWTSPGIETLAGVTPLRDYGSFIDSLKRNEFISIADVREDPRTNMAAAALEGKSARSFLNVPVVERGLLVAVLFVNHADRRDWTEAEMAFMREVASRTRIAVERARANLELKKSEEHYRLLFDSIEQGFCTIKISFDANNWPEDFVFVQVNAAFERHSGLKNAAGRRVRELVPELESYWYEIYGKIALTGEPRRFEQEAGPLGKSFEVYAFRVGAPEERQVGILFNDVTDRAQLRESQEQSDFALTAAGLGQWSLNLTDHTTRRTLRHDQIFGYDRVLPTWTYEKFLEHVMPEDREAIDVSFQKSVAGGSPWDVECRIRRADGALRNIWIKGQVRRGPGSQSSRMLGIVGDITDRKQAEERQAFRLRLAETLRPLSNAVDVQAVASRLLGEHLGANRVVYFEIRGNEYIIERDYTSGVEPLAGRYSVDSFGPSISDSLFNGRTVVEADATIVSNRPKSEREAFASIHVKGHVDVPLVKGGRFVAGMTVHHSNERDWSSEDVALIEDTAERTWAALEQVRAESALQLSEERSAFVRRSTGVGFWYCDLPFEVLQWDDLVKEHFHLPPDATVTIDTFYERIHPDDREPTRQAIDESIQGHTFYNVYYRTVNALTGSVKWIRAIGRTFYAENGAPIRFDGVTLDVTEQKNAEARLREADRRKDEFLAILAHELRNPLAPIRTGLEILQRGGVGATAEKTRGMMERQLLHLVRLVDDLLEASRVSTGKFELRKERIRLQDVISAALETSRAVVERDGRVLSVVVSDTSLFVNGDPIRLAQVVSNLLTNAAKYTDRGGRIQISVSQEDAFAIVKVSDNGIGIPRDMLESIFDMFTQVDRAVEKTTGGLGIGLSLVNAVVEMHGGKVRASSAGAGKGSEFEVRLPMADPTRSDQDVGAGQGGKPALARPRRILIIDDNIDAADSLGQLLELMGNEVITAADGRSGIDKGREFLPDTVISDIGMPSMSGYDVARAIRSEEWGKGIFLIALTGYGQEDDLRKCKDAGFDHRLLKPVESEELLRLLHRKTV